MTTIIYPIVHPGSNKHKHIAFKSETHHDDLHKASVDSGKSIYTVFSRLNAGPRLNAGIV